jgi:hypothetical protein
MEENVLQINPELARRCLQSAHLCMETEPDKEALKLFDEVIAKHQPQNVEAHLESAKIFAKYKQPQSIIKVITRLHNFSPKTPESLVLLARAQFQLGLTIPIARNPKGDFCREEGFPGSGGFRRRIVHPHGRYEALSRNLSP